MPNIPCPAATSGTLRGDETASFPGISQVERGAGVTLHDQAQTNATGTARLLARFGARLSPRRLANSLAGHDNPYTQGLTHLRKNERAKKELAKKGMAIE